MPALTMTVEHAITMTVEQWAAVRPNPIQRDTERHALYSKLKHLSKSEKPQWIVHAADVKGVGLVKLDGHTRSLLWNSGELEKPPGSTVLVIVIEADTMEEAKQLYLMYDNLRTGIKAPDKVWGAFREQGLVPKSELIRKGGVSSALELLYQRTFTGDREVYALVAVFRRELMLLDAANLNRKKMQSGVLAAAIIGLMAYGEPALEFFKRYCRNEGMKGHGFCDPVQAVTEALLRGGYTSSGNARIVSAGLVLRGLEKFVTEGPESQVRLLRKLDMREFTNNLIKERYNVDSMAKLVHLANLGKAVPVDVAFGALDDWKRFSEWLTETVEYDDFDSDQAWSLAYYGSVESFTDAHIHLSLPDERRSLGDYSDQLGQAASIYFNRPYTVEVTLDEPVAPPVRPAPTTKPDALRRTSH